MKDKCWGLNINAADAECPFSSIQHERLQSTQKRAKKGSGPRDISTRHEGLLTMGAFL